MITHLRRLLHLLRRLHLPLRASPPADEEAASPATDAWLQDRLDRYVRLQAATAVRRA